MTVGAAVARVIAVNDSAAIRCASLVGASLSSAAAAAVRPWAAVLLLFLATVGIAEAADEFEFYGDRTSMTLAEGRERTVLEGNAGIRSDELVIEADRVEIFGTDFRHAIATGNVRVVDNKHEITMRAERLHYDRETEVMLAEGAVELEDERNEVVVRGGFLEYRSEQELMIVQAAVRIQGEDLETRSELARFQRDTNVLELSGVPHVRRRDDEYRAMRIVIDLDRDHVTMQGRVSGAIGARAAEERAEEPPEEPPLGPLEEDDADDTEEADEPDETDANTND